MMSATEIKPYKDSTQSKKKQITQMFDSISEEYDGLNRVISMGIDQSWRKKLVQIAAAQRPQQILDVATGTGDLAILLAKANPSAQIIGLDLSAGMLAVGRKKIEQLGLNKQIQMQLGDSEKLPFEEATFDIVSVAFGVRNFEQLTQGLAEIHRVLRPNGSLLILETAVPTRFPFKQCYYIYNRYILPSIGKIFSKDRKAYGYLSESAIHFPYGETFCTILKEIGFGQTKHYSQTFGVAAIYHAIK